MVIHFVSFTKKLQLLKEKVGAIRSKVFAIVYRNKKIDRKRQNDTSKFLWFQKLPANLQNIKCLFKQNLLRPAWLRVWRVSVLHLTLYPGSSFSPTVSTAEPDCQRVSLILQPYRNTFFFLECPW